MIKKKLAQYKHFKLIALLSLLLLIFSSVLAFFPNKAHAAQTFFYSSKDNRTITGPAGPDINTAKNADYQYRSGGRYTVYSGGCTYEIITSNNQIGGNSGVLHNSCRPTNDIDIVINAFGTDNTGGSNPSNTDSTTTRDENSCEARSGTLGWIMCPVVRMLDGAMNWVDTQIQALLEIPQGYYQNSEIKAAWGNVRNIAYIILIPVMLVMVIGTALDFSFIDAYTVKKALPRMVAAIIFIALSYTICVFLIQLFNVVGEGILGLITAPFASAQGSASDLTLASLFNGSILTGIFGAFASAIGIVIVLWLFGGTLLLFAAIAFLVLILRQMFIVALLLVSPLAIIAWIFPGNDKLWKTWWGTFSKLLGMFPLIMILIGVGRIFAFIIKVNSPFGEGLSSIMKLIAYMIPYAFIPFTFKVAGGAFATLAGIVNDRSKGFFDRQRKSRQAKLERTAGGKMFKGAPAGGLRDRFNAIGAGVMHANRAGFRPKNWKTNIGNAVGATERQQIEKTLAEDTDYAVWKDNDTLNAYASLSRNEDELRDFLTRFGGYQNPNDMEKDIRRVETMRRKMGSSAMRQMTFLQATAGGTVYGRDRVDATTGQTVGELNWTDAMVTAAGNDDAALAYLAANGKSRAMNVGRIDEGGASFGAIFDNARSVRAGQMTGVQANEAIARDVVNSQGAGILLHPSMKPYAVENLAPYLTEGVVDAVNNGDAVGTINNLAQIASVYENANATSPNKARIIRDQVMSREIQFDNLPNDLKEALQPAMAVRNNDGTISYRTSGTITYAAAVEALRGNPQFQLNRREYQSQFEQAAANPQTFGPGGPQGPQTTAQTTPG